MSFLRRQESTHSLIKEFLSPPLSLPRLVVTVFVTVIVLCITTSVLALNEPPKQTPDYIVLEPETWVGQKLPILQHIDICQQLEKGNWLILLYHHDCPDCTAAIPKYEQMARDLAGSEGFLRIALIEVPPYGKAMVNNNSPCALGRLASSKEWFITTPAVVLLEDSIVRNVWEGKTLSFDAVCRSAGM